MRRTQRGPSVHKGVSFGSILMVTVTVVVVGLSAAILPRLLGKADFDVNVSTMLSALQLDDSLTELSLSDIPISAATPTPVPSAEPTVDAPIVTAAPTTGENK